MRVATGLQPEYFPITFNGSHCHALVDSDQDDDQTTPAITDEETPSLVDDKSATTDSTSESGPIALMKLEVGPPIDLSGDPTLESLDAIAAFDVSEDPSSWQATIRPKKAPLPIPAAAFLATSAFAKYAPLFPVRSTTRVNAAMSNSRSPRVLQSTMTVVPTGSLPPEQAKLCQTIANENAKFLRQSKELSSDNQVLVEEVSYLRKENGSLRESIEMREEILNTTQQELERSRIKCTKLRARAVKEKEAGEVRFLTRVCLVTNTMPCRRSLVN